MSERYLLDSSLKANSDLFREHVDVYLPVFSILFPFELLISNLFFCDQTPSCHPPTEEPFQPSSLYQLSVTIWRAEGTVEAVTC